MTSRTNFTHLTWSCNRDTSLVETACSLNVRITALIVGLLALFTGAILLGGVGQIAGWALLGTGPLFILLSASIKQVRNQPSLQLPRSAVPVPAPLPQPIQPPPPDPERDPLPQPLIVLPPTSEVPHPVELSPSTQTPPRAPETPSPRPTSRVQSAPRAVEERGAPPIIDEERCRRLHRIGFDTRYVNVEFLGDHLKIDPQFYLDRFYREIREQGVKGSFLELQGRILDASGRVLGVGFGVGRGYLNEMLLGVLRENPRCFIVASSGLVIPDSQEGQSLELFQKLGSVIMYCYLRTLRANSPPQSLITGLRFDSSLFRTAFALNSNEIDAHFENLSSARKMVLYKALQPENQHVVLLNIQQWNPQKIGEARQLLEWEGYVEIPESEAELRPLLLEVLSERFDSQLKGIHAFAKGMKAFCTTRVGSENRIWEQTFHNSDYQAFSDKVQGNLDRGQVAAGIGGRNIQNSEIQKKLTWLREWITNHATPEELKAFVKFQTDCDGWPEGVITMISEGNNTPFPKVHTCGFSMELSTVPSSCSAMNDHTYDNFIACLKVAMSQTQAYTEF